MNKTKIDWCDYTWNPITGCKNNCWYCYGRGIRKRFEKAPWEEIKYYPNRLEEPFELVKPSKIFVGSMTDMFGGWLPEEKIKDVLRVTLKFPEHTYIFLTKNPNRYTSFCFNKNCWIGVTIDCKSHLQKLYPLTNKTEAPVRFISFEPLLEPMGAIDLLGINWIIVGALTGHGNKYQPKREWIESIIEQADFYNIPVFMKNNLRNIWLGKLRQEYPK